MIVPSDLRYERPDREVVILNKQLEVDAYCHYCQKAYPWDNKSGRIDFNYVHLHHKHPIADGGKDIANNREYLCFDCHKDLHLFLDAFRVLNINLNYEYLNTVYVWYFSKRPTQKIKEKYPAEFHCDVDIFKSGIEKLFYDFCNFVLDLKNAGHNLVLYDIYIYNLMIDYKLGFWAKRLVPSIKKPSAKDFEKYKLLSLYSNNPSIIRISKNYEAILPF